MSMKEFNNDDQMRRMMNEMPEEKPSQSDWDKMKARLEAEGLIGKSNKKTFFYFSTGIVLLALLSTFFLVNNPSPSLIQTTATVTPPANLSIVTQNNSAQMAAGQPGSVVPGNNPVSTSAIITEASSSAGGNKTIEYLSNSTSSVSEIISIKNEINSASPLNSPVNAVTDESEHDIVPLANISHTVTGEGNSSIVQNNSSSDSVKTEKQDISEEMSGYTPPHRKSLRKWFAGSYFSYDRNSFGFTASNNIGKDMVKAGFPSEDNFQFTTGITMGYSFTSRFSVEAGVLYSQKKTFDYSYLNIVANTPDYNFYEYHFSGRYIAIPVKGNFYVYQTHHHPNINWGIYTSVGLMTTFSMPQKDNDYFLHSSMDETGNRDIKIPLKLGSVGETGIFALGYQMKFNSYWDVYVEPGYEYHFTSVMKHTMNKDIPVQQYLRTPRVACGVKYNF